MKPNPNPSLVTYWLQFKIIHLPLFFLIIKFTKYLSHVLQVLSLQIFWYCFGIFWPNMQPISERIKSSMVLLSSLISNWIKSGEKYDLVYFLYDEHGRSGARINLAVRFGAPESDGSRIDAKVCWRTTILARLNLLWSSVAAIWFTDL